MRRPLRSEVARTVANLAIELGDPGRMAKARRIHRSNGVSSVELIPGSAFAQVTDAAGEIHDVEVAVIGTVLAGEVPAPEHLELSCTCDDDGDTACIHRLAALLGIAEELEGNSRLLDVWTAPAIEVSEVPVSTPGSFLGGPWQAPQVPKLIDRPVGDPPVLIADGLDAGPVVADALETIRRGVSRFRPHR